MMRILHLTLSFRSGGRRMAIERLALGLRDLEVESDLACLDELGCEREEIESIFGAIDVVGRGKPFRPRSVRRLVELCTRRRIDIIHAHDAGSQLAGAMACRHNPKMRLLMTFHRSLSIESSRFRDKIRNAYSTALSSAIVVGSSERKRHFIDNNYVRPSKVVRIPFGLDVASYVADLDVREEVRRELQLEDGVVAVAVIGHFGPEKGIDRAVRAFRMLRKRRPELEVDLLICGAGTESQRVETEEAVAGDSRIRLLGYRRDIPRLLQGFDVLLHAPRQEAFGLVVIEAMASGLPVVAASVGGLTDLVVHGRTGLLAAEGDIAALAEGIEKIALSGEMRREMGAAARGRAANEYTVRLCAERHRTLYLDVLHQRPPRGVDEGSVVAPQDQPDDSPSGLRR